MCQPKEYGFLHHSGLESGMVFEETAGVYEHINCFNSMAKWIRKKDKYANSNRILRNLFFVCNDDIISWGPGLKKGIDFRGQVWKLVWKKGFFRIWRTRQHTSTKNSQEHPPGQHSTPRGGGTLDFMRQGWSNGAKIKTPKKSLDQNLTPKNPMPNIRATKISRKH